ncbi:UNVERIFIED_CONTAM: hypothetical protein HDU68_001967, partial [Siphonaria sp. JEL0065]
MRFSNFPTFTLLFLSVSIVSAADDGGLNVVDPQGPPMIYWPAGAVGAAVNPGDASATIVQPSSTSTVVSAFESVSSTATINNAPEAATSSAKVATNNPEKPATTNPPQNASNASSSSSSIPTPSGKEGNPAADAKPSKAVVVPTPLSAKGNIPKSIPQSTPAATTPKQEKPAVVVQGGGVGAPLKTVGKAVVVPPNRFKCRR